MGQYIISIVAVAVIISISHTLIEKKSMFGSIFRLVTGLILTILVVAPWTDLRLSDLQDLKKSTEIDASALVQQGQDAYQLEINKLIKEQTQAYILDKAVSLGMNLCVDVVLTDQTPATIEAIKIEGNASPYGKQRIIRIIQEDLDVTQERIVWT